MSWVVVLSEISLEYHGWMMGISPPCDWYHQWRWPNVMFHSTFIEFCLTSSCQWGTIQKERTSWITFVVGSSWILLSPIILCTVPVDFTLYTPMYRLYSPLYSERVLYRLYLIVSHFQLGTMLDLIVTGQGKATQFFHLLHATKPWFLHQKWVVLYGAFLKWGYPQSSSIWMGFSRISHPFWCTAHLYGNIHMPTCDSNSLEKCSLSLKTMGR